MTGHCADRRLILRLGAASLASTILPLPALAEGNPADDPKLRFINVPPLLLPGREKYAFIRLVMQLVVRKSEKLPVESALVTAYMPRIVGKLTETLPADDSLTHTSGPAQLADMKRHVRELANGIIGQPLVEDVLISSLLTG